MIIRICSVVLEMTLKMLKHTRNGRRRNCVGFLSAEELFEYKCDKLLIHLSVSSHQRRSRWGLHSPVLCQRNCHICLIFKFHLSVQPSVFKQTEKANPAWLWIRCLMTAGTPKEDRGATRDSTPWTTWLQGQREPFSSRQSQESSNPNCIFWQQI